MERVAEPRLLPLLGRQRLDRLEVEVVVEVQVVEPLAHDQQVEHVVALTDDLESSLNPIKLSELEELGLCESLEKLPERIKSRRESEKKYFDFISKNPNLPLEAKLEPSNMQGNGYLQVSIAKSSYQDLSAKLNLLGITTGNVYPSPMSAQKGTINPILVSKDHVTEEISKKVINLPLFPYMTDSEIDYVCDCLVNSSS